MNKSKNALAFIIIIFAVLIFAGILYFVKKEVSEKTASKENPKSEVAMTPKMATPKEVGAGNVGETKETLGGEKIVTLPPEVGGPPRVLPSAIFNESGKIKEIKKNSLIIEGTGYNFADQRPRDLTLKFTENTVTNAQDGTKQLGFQGLTYLKIGESISFESPENIRGKEEFEVTYVNKF